MYSKTTYASGYIIHLGAKVVHSPEYTEQFILVLLFINYCVIFHMDNCKSTFVPPCVSLNFYGISRKRKQRSKAGQGLPGIGIGNGELQRRTTR